MKDPSSANGFTVIFAKARDEKKTNGTVAGGPQKNNKGPPPQQPQKETEPSSVRYRISLTF